MNKKPLLYPDFKNSPKISPKKIKSLKSLSPVCLSTPEFLSNASQKNLINKSPIRPSKTYNENSDLSQKQDRFPDLYLKKFELVSMRLEKLLGEVHEKYNFDRNWKSLSPKVTKEPGIGAEKVKKWSFIRNLDNQNCNNSRKDDGDSVFKKPLNKLTLRSKLFHHTAKWISISPR